MPNGVPVATVALNAAKNAGILAAQILAVADPKLMKRIVTYKESLKDKVMDSDLKMEKEKTVKPGKAKAKK